MIITITRPAAKFYVMLTTYMSPIMFLRMKKYPVIIEAIRNERTARVKIIPVKAAVTSAWGSALCVLVWMEALQCLKIV